MSCEQSQMQLHAYFDGELDAASAAAFEGHLKACAECRSNLASEEALRASIVNANLYERAPASLRRSIAAQLSPATGAARARSTQRANFGWRGLALAASFLIAAVIGWQVHSYFPSLSSQPPMVAAALDAHLRSLQPSHLADVESTDQHTVKPWFDGKLAFAPPVRDFATDGFPLLGGRIDVLNGNTVAALIYGRRKHIINVFVWSASAADVDRSAHSGASQGYNWATWQSGGFAFCAVSDVNAADLQQLSQHIATP